LGIFFKNKEEKSTKTMVIGRIIILVLLAVLLIFGVVNGFDLILLSWMFILAGVGFVFEGVEKCLQKTKGNGFLLDFGFAILLFISAFSL